MQTAGKDGTTRRLMDRVIELETLNAELLAAIELLIYSFGSVSTEQYLQYLKEARAAITKAKGET